MCERFLNEPYSGCSYLRRHDSVKASYINTKMWNAFWKNTF